MINLLDIASGWYSFINATPYTKKLMKYRLSICETCPNKVILDPVTKFIVKKIDSTTVLCKCKLCKCPLSALTANLKSECKIGKWGIAGTEETNYY